MTDKVRIGFKEIGSNWSGIISPRSIQKCLKYSDSPEELEAFLSKDDLAIKVKPVGLTKWEENNDKETLAIKVRIENNDNIFTFNFHMSLLDTVKIFYGSPGRDSVKDFHILYPFSRTVQARRDYERDIKKRARGIQEIRDGLLYSILSCSRSDYWIEEDFHDFCDMYGYDSDSRRAERLHKLCLKQAEGLQEVFNDDIIECFPY